VEYGNSSKEAVLIFANPVETFSGTQTLWAGQIYSGSYTVGAGQTLYIEGGAVLRGNIVIDSGGKVVGRGIIDGSDVESWINIGHKAQIPTETWDADNIEISGITIFDPNAWAVQLQHSSNITINNLKIITSRANGDGISIQSANDISIRNSFIRSWDDGIVIKNYTNKNSHDITVEDCVLWTDHAQSLEIGFETNKAKKNRFTNDNPEIYNVTFNNIAIIHAMHKAPISIHNGDNANIHHINFMNVTIDDYMAGEGDGWNYLIDFANLTGEASGGPRNDGRGSWTTELSRGSIHDVLVESVKILHGKNPGARFDSFGGGSIYNTVIRNVYHGNTELSFHENVGLNCDIQFKRN
jgi:hypothetical protein